MGARSCWRHWRSMSATRRRRRRRAAALLAASYWTQADLDAVAARARIKRGLRRRERRAAALLAASYWTQADLDAIAERAGELVVLFEVET